MPVVGDRQRDDDRCERHYGNHMMAQMQSGGGGGQGESDGGESPVVPGQIEVWTEVNITVGAKERE